MTIQDLVDLADVAAKTPPLNGPEWPPSVYYRYLAEVVAKKKARVFVELGTCGGGCARNVALKNPNTKVITIDIEKLPQVSLAEKQAPNMKFIMGDSAQLAHTIGKQYAGEIDVLFIDTVHEYSHVMNEFNSWKPYLAPKAIVAFDDLYRETMDRVWNELPGEKSGFHTLREMHLSGAKTDGGFGITIQ